MDRAELKRRIQSRIEREAAECDAPGCGRRPTVAEEAADLVAGARADHYGEPVRNLARVGVVWGVLLDLPGPIPPRTVALLMAALKLVREGGPRAKRDNLVDAYGYLLIAEMAITEDGA